MLNIIWPYGVEQNSSLPNCQQALVLASFTLGICVLAAMVGQLWEVVVVWTFVKELSERPALNVMRLGVEEVSNSKACF
jgi:hypothetical protein